MTKKERIYNEKYGDIPSNPSSRLDYLLSHMNLSRAKSTVHEELHKISNIGWKTKSYVIYILPEGTPRPRKGKYNVFYVKGAADKKKLFKSLVKDEDITIIQTPVKFYCYAYLPIPSSMTSVEKILAEMGYIRPQAKPDWDNIGKGYCDMMQGILIDDDSQVIEGMVKKFYSIKPRIEVMVCYMEDFDSAYNKKKKLQKGRLNA